MPTSNENEMVKGRIYAVVDGEYREVMELQGEITLHECDEQLWQYDYVRVVRCGECKYIGSLSTTSGYHNCSHQRAMIYAPVDGFCCYGERRTDNDE